MEKSNFVLEDSFKLEKQNYLYCLLGIDIGVYSWPACLSNKRKFLPEQSLGIHIPAGMIRTVEHWNKAVK